MHKLLNFFPSKALQALLLLPQPPRKFIVEQITNQALATAIEDEELDFLHERWLALHVSDHKVTFYFTFKDGKIQFSESAQGDITFSGKLVYLLQMASKSVDPDTLFFQRKLAISGDTELGLEIKNLIDSLELENLPIWLNHPLRFYRYVRQLDAQKMSVNTAQS